MQIQKLQLVTFDTTYPLTLDDLHLSNDITEMYFCVISATENIFDLPHSLTPKNSRSSIDEIRREND